MPKDKYGTSRITCFNELDLKFCYTLEVSIHGTLTNPNKFIINLFIKKKIKNKVQNKQSLNLLKHWDMNCYLLYIYLINQIFFKELNNFY